LPSERPPFTWPQADGRNEMLVTLRTDTDEGGFWFTGLGDQWSRRGADQAFSALRDGKVRTALLSAQGCPAARLPASLVRQHGTRNEAGKPVTELRNSLRWGAVAEWAGDRPWPVLGCADRRYRGRLGRYCP
jgi:hypothetical protein